MTLFTAHLGVRSRIVGAFLLFQFSLFHPIAHGEDYVFEPVADALVEERSSQGNFGDEFLLRVGNSTEFYQKTWSYLKFDLSVLPPDAKILDATLYLWVSSFEAWEPVAIRISPLTDEWSESGINWSNRPIPPAFQTISPVDDPGRDSAIQFRVTEQVQGWIDESVGKAGFVLAAPDARENPFYVSFFSRDALRCGPQLAIEYTTQGTAPPARQVDQCSPRGDGEGPVITLTADNDPDNPLTVTATAEDPDGIYRLKLIRGGRASPDEFIDTSASTNRQSVDWALMNLEHGFYTFCALAWDSGLSASSFCKQFPVYPSGQPPMVEISHRYEGDEFILRAEAKDDTGLKWVRLWGNGHILGEKAPAADADDHLELEISCGDTVIECHSTEPNVLLYSAEAEDENGYVTRTGSRYVLIGEEGFDSDGDGLSDDIERLIGINPHSNDTDGDGLYDHWEVLGVDRNSDREIDVDLPAYGARAAVKDVFLEIDWMENAADSLKPDPVALQFIVNKFRDYGIALHIDTGALGAVDVPHETLPYLTNITNEGQHHTDIKSDSKYFDPMRSGIFYYMTVIHPVPNSTSKAGSGGNIVMMWNPNTSRLSQQLVLMHELGHAMKLGHGGRSQDQTVERHVLGPDGQPRLVTLAASDDLLRKPHYFSIMNYHYDDGITLHVPQEDGTSEVVDVISYYTGPGRVIRESSLDEEQGYRQELVFETLVWDWREDRFLTVVTGLRGVPELRLHKALGGPQNDPTQFVHPSCPYLPQYVGLADGGFIDWDLDGAPSVGRSYSWDLTQHCDYSIPGRFVAGENCNCDAWTVSDLYVFNDIVNLGPQIASSRSDFYWTGTQSSEVPTNTSDFAEWEYADGVDNDADARIDEGFPDTDGDGIVDQIDNCSFTPNPDQLDVDRNYRGDICEAPPGPPRNLRGNEASDGVELDWLPPTSGGKIIGYNVYRRAPGETGFVRLGETFPTVYATAAYTDVTHKPGTAYAVSAVNLYRTEGLAATREISSIQTGSAGLQDELRLLLIFLLILLVLTIFWMLLRQRRPSDIS